MKNNTGKQRLQSSRGFSDYSEIGAHRRNKTAIVIGRYSTLTHWLPANNPFSKRACLMSRSTKLHWFISCASVLLAGFLFGATLDPVSSPAWFLVNQALFVCLASYLLLPAAHGLAGLFGNAVAGMALFVVVTCLAVTPVVPAIILLQVAVVVFCLGLLAWSLTQFLQCLFPARQTPHIFVVLLIACLGAAPIWLGPLMDIYQPGDRVIDGIVSMTPLTHVAVAAQYDYLRGEWLYQNSPFGSLHFVYPGFGGITAGYFLAVFVLQLIIRGITHHPQMLKSIHWLRNKS
jgi:hypothetical protein